MNIHSLTDDEYESLKKKYPVGTVIKLHKMDDIQAPPPGTLGTVKGVFKDGGIAMHWHSGSSLNLYPEIDCFEIVE